jgi:hypothetical protein
MGRMSKIKIDGQIKLIGKIILEDAINNDK